MGISKLLLVILVQHKYNNVFKFIKLNELLNVLFKIFFLPYEFGISVNDKDTLHYYDTTITDFIKFLISQTNEYSSLLNSTLSNLLEDDKCNLTIQESTNNNNNIID